MGTKKNNNPTILFIFGGSGDLTNRKLIPALYNLYLDNYLPEKFFIIGVGRTSFLSNEAYREKLLEGVQQFSRRKGEVNGTWKSFAENILYFERDLQDDNTYNNITGWINDKAKEWDPKPTVIFYLAVAPQLVPVIEQKLASNKICTDQALTRIVFEKP